MNKLFQLLVVVYSSISLVGCVTAKAVEYIEESAETVTHFWDVESIKFAAIKDDRYVRICVALSNETDKTTEELTIDLQQLSNTQNNESVVIEGLESGLSDESPFCSLYLEENEQPVTISEIHSDAADINEALYAVYQEPAETPTITLLHHESERYLVFSAPIDLYENLDIHAYDSYTQTEKRYSPGTVLVIIPALAADAVLITAMLGVMLLCVFLLPMCR